MRALIRSDVAAIAAIEGHVDEAPAGWRAALEIDPNCLMARLNRDLIEAELSFEQMSGDLGELKLAPAPAPSPLVGELATVSSPHVGEGGPKGRMGGGVGLGSADLPLASAVGNADPHLPFGHPLPRGEAEFGPAGRGLSGRPVRVAILSFLFNWPSTGVGNHDTAELAAFLARAGHDGKHFFAQARGRVRGKSSRVSRSVRLSAGVNQRTDCVLPNGRVDLSVGRPVH